MLQYSFASTKALNASLHCSSAMLVLYLLKEAQSILSANFHSQYDYSGPLSNSEAAWFGPRIIERLIMCSLIDPGE